MRIETQNVVIRTLEKKMLKDFIQLPGNRLYTVICQIGLTDAHIRRIIMD